MHARVPVSVRLLATCLDGLALSISIAHDGADDLGRCSPYPLQRFQQRVLVAAVQVDVVGRCVRCVEADGLADHEGNRLGLGLADRSARRPRLADLVQQLVGKFVREHRELLGWWQPLPHQDRPACRKPIGRPENVGEFHLDPLPSRELYQPARVLAGITASLCELRQRPAVCATSKTQTLLNRRTSSASSPGCSRFLRHTMGARIRMPFSPCFTWRPSFCHVRKPATRAASGRCAAMRSTLLTLYWWNLPSVARYAVSRSLSPFSMADASVSSACVTNRLSSLAFIPTTTHPAARDPAPPSFPLEHRRWSCRTAGSGFMPPPDPKATHVGYPFTLLTSLACPFGQAQFKERLSLPYFRSSPVARAGTRRFIYQRAHGYPMTAGNPFADLVIGQLFETLLPDFVLAFAFFTALVYAVLGRRFGQQRPAVAMSAALGMALAIGFVWWEQGRGVSVRTLGPLAVGFALILLGMVMFQAIRQTGGTWAGAAIALSASVLVGWALGFDWMLPPRILQTITTVALVIGVLAFLRHHRGSASSAHLPPVPRRAEVATARHDLAGVHEARQVDQGIRAELARARRAAKVPQGRPQERGELMLRLRRTLPAEGWLTERLARLREHAQYVRQGHLARVQQLRSVMKRLPADARRRASQELAARYAELQLDTRLDRLDRAVAENERRIRALTAEARESLDRSDHRKMDTLLREAEKLQKHNGDLLALIENAERKLAAIAQEIAKRLEEGAYA